MLENSLSRQTLAHFLRTRRERLKPGDVGLPQGNRRRTPGLRREEVAILAGVSPTWYALLEQARDVTPSHKVLDSLAQALNLSEPERRYIHQLVQSRTFPQRIERRHASTEAALQRICDSLDPDPAYVTNAVGDILGWNRATVAWFTDFEQTPENNRNLLLWMLTAPEAKQRLADWEGEVRSQIAHLRSVSASYPGRSCVTALVDQLAELSSTFRRIWDEHHVEVPKNDVRLLRHERLGVVPMRLTNVCDSSHPSLQIAVHTPDFSADPRETILRKVEMV